MDDSKTKAKYASVSIISKGEEWNGRRKPDRAFEITTGTGSFQITESPRRKNKGCFVFVLRNEKVIQPQLSFLLLDTDIFRSVFGSSTQTSLPICDVYQREAIFLLRGTHLPSFRLESRLEHQSHLLDLQLNPFRIRLLIQCVLFLLILVLVDQNRL